jgi:hypothetical protein
LHHPLTAAIISPTAAAMKIDIQKHLAEWNARQEFRREVGLPALDRSAELQRLRELLRRERREELMKDPLFRRALRRTVFRYKSRPDNNFNSIVGMGLAACVTKRMHERKRRSGR